MKVVSTVDDLRERRQKFNAQGRRLALVPTMGALHRAHRSLMDLAQTQADAVAVSIFVNPLQFGPNEDYARYPRSLEADLQLCKKAGVDLVFTPAVTELYPTGRQVSLSAGALGSVWEGAARPGHFDGMLTVVLKLLNIVAPQVAIFGQKDAQQLACIRRMVTDLNVPTEVVGAPIVREDDGLALSSRNRYLSVPDRATATALSAALRAAAGSPDPVAAVTAARRVLDAAAVQGDLELDYLSVVNPTTMAALPDDHVGAGLMIVAALVGGTRLIDNVPLDFPEPESLAPEPAAATAADPAASVER